MKLQVAKKEVIARRSPPPTGAWIETNNADRGVCEDLVAPSHGGVD